MHTSTFALQFKDARTIYKQVGESVPVPASWMTGPAKENVVLTDFSKAIPHEL